MLLKLTLLPILILQVASFEVVKSETDIDVTLTYNYENVNSYNQIDLKIAFQGAYLKKITKLIAITLSEFDMSDSGFSVDCQYPLQIQPPKVIYTSEDRQIYFFMAFFNKIKNPPTPGEKIIKITIINGTKTINMFLVLEIKDDQLKCQADGNGITFERSNLQFSFQYDFYQIEHKPIMFQDLQFQLEFPVFTSHFISCTNFTGLSNGQDCQSKENSIYVFNRNVEFLYNESQHSFIINNFTYPSNLEVYTATIKIFNSGNKLSEGQFNFGAYAPSEIERIVKVSSNSYATQYTTLQILLDSQKYILANSDMQFTLSILLVIDKLIINDIEKSFVQNDKVISIIGFNDQLLEQFRLKVEFQFQNLEYKQDIKFSFLINKISASLFGDLIYSIEPNRYKSFIVSRDTEVVDEETNLYINIELQNPIVNGVIYIQFPKELNLVQWESQIVSGSSFSFTYWIKNPSTICQTSRFESQAYQNDQFREQLLSDVVLIQKPNQLIKNLQISLSSLLSVDKTSLSVSLESQYIVQLRFDDTININEIKCQNCKRINFSVIELSKNKDVIFNIETPRLAKESKLLISTYAKECQQSQIEYQLVFKPNQFQIVPQITTRELNALNQWQFSIELPCDINEQDKLKIHYPTNLIIKQKLQCKFLNFQQNNFDCNTEINDLPLMKKHQVLRLLISQPLNPSKPQLLEWQFILVDKNGDQIAIFNSKFQDWEYEKIQLSNIQLMDNKFIQMKEALLRIALQFQVDVIKYEGNIIIYCDGCKQEQNQIVYINMEGNGLLEIPFRFFTIPNQYVYLFTYKLTTYYKGDIQQQGYFKQSISLSCSNDCAECESYDKCSICLVGYLYNSTCVDECPVNYYALNGQCYPCSIGKCTACAFLEKEICLECEGDLDLYLNQCVTQDYYTDYNNTNQTNNNQNQNNNQIIDEQSFLVIYNFPGLLLIIFLICLYTIIIKILNYSSISKTICFSYFSLLENGISIFLIIKFIIQGLYDLAFLSFSLLAFQIMLQLNSLLQLKTYIMIDTKYQQFKKEYWSIKNGFLDIMWIQLCLLHYPDIQIEQTSKVGQQMAIQE
ncbi:unnamed protein product (macronuclear) [Paramecium tetraurelia]|uniref:TNFR-Cys domain-containing protein n=1 Tax=Paramecium tetraurelia TaxID=5888 RepID=A0BXX4_PARTE|nr:uncharacterized protein GSPATT00033244001 [Paramecium tetraurelia]CAK63391.1 unnamed protein product [Paramecium tetraurelia]|eukprot:XP_001430789.1 hypothetical protein (macronuclear) [Paramecium tetraurelia strain d4-2]